MKNTVYMEEMDAFTYRDKLAQEAVMFIPVGALEQHGSHMAMCVDAALTKAMAGATAEALVAEIQGELDSISAYLADKERLTVAVLEDEGGTYRVYGEDTLGGNVATSGGAELAVGKHGDNGNISAEDLIAANPDAIFMVWYNGYTVNDADYAGEQVVELITENPAFASLDAVKNNRVFAINLNNVYCSGMRTLDGVLDFAQNLYPELYQ